MGYIINSSRQGPLKVWLLLKKIKSCFWVRTVVCHVQPPTVACTQMWYRAAVIDHHSCMPSLVWTSP